MVEYLEDQIERDPQEALPRPVQGSTTTLFRTGDPMVDKWEKSLANGETPDVTGDLLSAVSDEDRKKLQKFLKLEEPEEFKDDYTKEP